MLRKRMPEVWSDFDGTVIQKRLINRRMGKYPVPMLEGYLELLEGVKSSGVDIAGIVSSRLDIGFLYAHTRRTMGRLGLSEVFGGDIELRLTSSATGKARHLASRSQENTVGMLEDRHNNLAPELFKAMAEAAAKDGAETNPVILGLVPSGGGHRLDRFVSSAEGSEVKVRNDGLITVRGEGWMVGAVVLRSYSEEEGQRFAEILLEH